MSLSVHGGFLYGIDAGQGQDSAVAAPPTQLPTTFVTPITNIPQPI
ncbi:hypothetical protein U2F10_25520 [Leptothoe sp. EHU-05/26/07-4]